MLRFTKKMARSSSRKPSQGGMQPAMILRIAFDINSDAER